MIVDPAQKATLPSSPSDPPAVADPTTLTGLFFDGITDEERRFIVHHAKYRQFAQGSLILSDGDSRRELGIIQSGSALVTIRGLDGREIVIHRPGPGSTIGELSLFTGHRASASVRAATDMELLILSEERFRLLANKIPRLFANLGLIMAHKLAESELQPVRSDNDRIAILFDHNAPPLLGYALAASVAWHARRATVLLLIGDEPPPELSLAQPDRGRAIPTPCAHLVHIPSIGAEPGAFDAILEKYATRYACILVQLPATQVLPSLDIPIVCLDANGATTVPERARYAIRGWMSVGSRRPDNRGVLSVPPLSEADRLALAAGLLPASTAAGKALGWAARDLTRLKVGVALGAGSSKGFGHIGVLRALVDAGLPIDYIAGTSIGSCIAGLYCLGYGWEEMTDTLAEIGALAWTPAIPHRSILSLRRLKRHFQQLTGERRIENLPTPLAIVAADLLTHQQVVFRRGPIWPAILASIALPGAFPPQPIGGLLLVDGGMVNPVPSDVAALMGADTVIAVRLATHRLGPAVETLSAQAVGSAPWMVHTVVRAMEVMQTRITHASIQGATIQLDLDFAHEIDPGLRHFALGKRFVAIGEASVTHALPRIAAALPWVRPVPPI